MRIARIALLAALAFAGCRRECSDPLAPQIDRATFEPETWLIDAGIPDFRPHLISGWSADERWGEQGFSFVWGTGASSTIRLNRYGTAPVTLRFRCAPMETPDHRVQTVTTILNGAALATTPLRSGFAIYELAIPAARLRTGINTLAFRYAYSSKPGPRDQRDLAVAWDWIEIVESHAKPNMRVARGQKDAIVIPYRGALHLPVPFEPGSVLQIDSIDIEGEVEGPDRGRVVINGAAVPVAQAVRLPLTRAALDIVVLEPRGGAPSATGVILRNPRVVRHCR